MATARSEAVSLQLLSRVSSAGRRLYSTSCRRPAAAPAGGIAKLHNHSNSVYGHEIAAKRQSRVFSSSPSPSLAAPADVKRIKRNSVPTSSSVAARGVSPADGKRKIAVLGGGLTGLTTAHYLARHAPDAQITVFELGDRLGGWVMGADFDTPEGKVVMQAGPRMVRSMKGANRYDDLVFYDVLANLGIEDQLKDVGGQAGTRYLYYPDHLVRLPGPPMTPDNLWNIAKSLYQEPLWDGLLPAALHYLKHGDPPSLTQESRAAVNEDESVGHFLERLCGDDRLVKNVASAMMHGIHGGDIYKLSAKHTLFARLWYQMTGGGDKSRAWTSYKELSLMCDIMDGPNRAKVFEMAQGAVERNMLAFDDGMLTLVRSLERDLQNQSNVKIKLGTGVKSLTPVSGGKVSVRTESQDGTATEQFDKVISTITAKALANAAPAGSLSALAETHAVSIQVVSLWYPERGLLKDNPGFGFLVPVSTPNNDEDLLGVIFDSEAHTSEDEPGTKLTVMMGGHHWDGNTYTPSEEQAYAMAQSAVKKTLGIPYQSEKHAMVRFCGNCLPQHYVGHRKLMARAHEQLLQAFGGGLSVAGPSYTPAGIMPSMRAGYEAAMRVATQTSQPWTGTQRPEGQTWWSMLAETKNDKGYEVFRGDHIGETGLAGFAQDDGDTLEPLPHEALFFRTKAAGAVDVLDEHGRPSKWIGSPLK
ncbi:hypothetical protein Micbo1qcDRAFT_163209 [Microdochium bolleyi]|uniref:Protoporphyrinogen oxidase n=1 Tax=Microdochium bolleyi TaxID=196109 RepID=A0A136J316_9PEZI|nr:hypothetical protein Micbo1qcDRAFT_163209 [Microdochium bolleyi]